MMKMKISLSFVIRTLAVINLFLPICTAVCNIFGYRFSLFNYTVCSVVFAVLSVACVVYSFIIKEKISKKSDTAMLVFLPFLSLVNWGLYLYESKSESVVVKICVFICFICSAVLVIKYIRPIILKNCKRRYSFSCNIAAYFICRNQALSVPENHGCKYRTLA